MKPEELLSWLFVFADHVCTTNCISFAFAYLQLDIWDTGGTERYRTITRSYYRHAKAVVLVYDVSSSRSLYSLGLWLQDAQYFVPNAVPILIGNKSDLPPEEDEVNTPDAFAASRNIKHHFKVSVKEDDGIRQAFETIAMVLSCTLEDSWESIIYNDSEPVIKPYGLDATITVEPLMAHRSSCTGTCSKF